MLRLLSGAVCTLLVCRANGAVVGARTGREAACLEQEEYRSGSVCCQNCPAGTYVAEPCSAAGRRGTCRKCDDGTFMEHSNGLRQCFPCTACRSDQEVVTPCTHTLNTECRCGPGRFCHPDQACELCKKCSRCGRDEEAVRNCTPTANAECKKVQSTPVPPSVAALVAVVIAVAVVIFLAVAGVCVCKRRRRTASRSSSAERKPGQDLRGDSGALGRCWSAVADTPQLVRTLGEAAEERQALRDSCSSSASTSQHSLTGLAFCPAPAPPSATPPPPPTWDWEPFPPLVAVNGEESLRHCFEFFEELDMDYHRKFFRHLNLNDNVVKGKEELPYEDRLHQLLHIWLEKEGRGASLDRLLQVLLDLDQRRTAENIRELAVHHGHYLEG